MEQENNVYFKARKEAAERNDRLWSRERAAELLGLSVSTLTNYELGLTKIIPPESIVMMANEYNAPHLTYHYCSNECPIGRCMPIPTNHTRLDSLTVQALKTLSMACVEEAKEKMLDVLEEGRLTDKSEQTLMGLIKYIESLTKTMGELRLAYHKMFADEGKRVW